MRTLLCAIFVLRLLADLATPHLPGAFQFDPDASVEGLRTATPRAADPVPVTLRPVPEPGERLAAPPSTRPPRPGRAVAVARTLRPRQVPPTRDALADPTEDHGPSLLPPTESFRPTLATRSVDDGAPTVA